MWLKNKKSIQLNYNKLDQLIINEYKSGQGISAHVDCEPCFRDGIISVTIGCSGIMTFENEKKEKKKKMKIMKK